MNQIYLGWDRREAEPYMVACKSILARTDARSVHITPLMLSNLPMLTRPIEWKDGRMWCPISQAPMATEFAISRFCVPFVVRNLALDATTHPYPSQWALFMDSDIVCLADINELFALADDRYAVMVVKHKQESGPDTKMDNQAQLYYSRKNWSSVVLWNCAHPSHARFTLEHLNTWPGRDLHAFKWLEDSEIGELPPEWNHLVGISKFNLVLPKLLHFTLGGPWFKDWKGGSMDETWIAEAGCHNRVTVVST